MMVPIIALPSNVAADWPSILLLAEERARSEALDRFIIDCREPALAEFLVAYRTVQVDHRRCYDEDEAYDMRDVAGMLVQLAGGLRDAALDEIAVATRPHEREVE